MLDAEVVRDGKVLERSVALNDVGIARESLQQNDHRDGLYGRCVFGYLLGRRVDLYPLRRDRQPIPSPAGARSSGPESRAHPS